MAIDFDARCDVLVTRFSDYLEQTLEPAEAEALEQHLVICTGCAEYVAQLRATVAGAGKLRDHAIPPPTTLARLAQLFRAHRRDDEAGS